MTTATTQEDHILSAQAAGVLTLTLNRPKVLNALTLAMMKDLRGALKEADRSNDVRCVILTGSGRAFSAGADLSDLEKRQAKKTISLGDELRRNFNPLILQLRNMETPVIGAVNGMAVGAGASLILATDIKLMADDAKFISAFVTVGLAPDSGLTWVLPRALGMAKALEHAWTAKPITAEEAGRCGLVNEVVPAYRLEAESLALAAKLVKAPPQAVALTKRAVIRAMANSFEDQLEYEAQMQDILGKTKDHKEGVAAFLEKRPPEFTGE